MQHAGLARLARHEASMPGVGYQARWESGVPRDVQGCVYPGGVYRHIPRGVYTRDTSPNPTGVYQGYLS